MENNQEERPILSVLVPSVVERLHTGEKVTKSLDMYAFLCACAQAYDGAVEVLMLTDNRKRTIGAKRQSLLDVARGEFVAYVDDGDEVSLDYVDQIVKAIMCNPDADVITFRQQADVTDAEGNTVTAIVEFGLGNPDEPFPSEMPKRAGAVKALGDAVTASDGTVLQKIRRNAWHVCAWRRSLARFCAFPTQGTARQLW